jgi:hypothetical protein
VRGLSKPEWQLQATILAISPVAFLMIVFLTLGGWQTDTALKISLASTTMLFTDLLLLELIAHPRRLILDSQGVTFRYRLHSERRSWSSLEPVLKRYTGAMADGVAVSYRYSNGRRRGHWLSIAQARALFAYPSGKEWSPGPGVRELLANT